jgi:N-acetylmuramoyl-L-alanine amidase
MIGRRQFLMITALGAVPLPPMGMQEIAPAQRRTKPGGQAHELPQETIEPTQERKSAQEPSNQLIVINPGHYKYSGENLGAHVPGIGHEYIINTQLARALHKKLQEIGLQAIVARDEQNYLPEIIEFMADHNTRLEREYDAHIRATNYRRHRELSRREAILQLGIMRYAEARDAAAMIDIHVDDQLRKRRRRRAEAKGFSVILNQTASGESGRLQGDLCSALRKTLPLNRCYHIKNARRGIFILGTSELRFSVPSCLVECGFMRQQYVIDGNKKHICDPEAQDICAASLARGLANYFGISGG